MTTQEVGDYVFFSHARGIGPTRFAALCQQFGGPAAARAASQAEISRVIGTKVTEEFFAWRRSFDLDRVLDYCRSARIFIIPGPHPSYPEALRQLTDPPICLYVKCGERPISSLKKGYFIGIVGSRNHSAYGGEMATAIAHDLAAAGVTIVSGMALGIDALAHHAALDAQGRTVAFLGSGVDIVYPSENQKLYDRIVAEGGLLVSEFPPLTRPIPGFFIARNRLIAGLSQGLVIVEGSAKSGSLTTASYAAHQGKDVYAVPGHVTSPLAQAPLILLKQGAKLVTQGADILADLSLEAKASLHTTTPPSLQDPLEQKIYALLQIESELYIDDLAQKTETSVSLITAAVSMMEISGYVSQTSKGSVTIIH